MIKSTVQKTTLFSGGNSLQRRQPWVCTKCAHRLSKKLSTAAEPYDKRLPAVPSLTNREYLNISSSSIASYWDTLPPSKSQLKHASNYFHHHSPKFLWSAPKFHSMDFGASPEVAFLGRSNVGKSSLLNALFGTKLAHTSSKRGRTRAMNAFSIGADDSNGDDGRKLVVMDMPGYGKGGKEEWGREILKYMEKRKELKMAFVLIDSEHGLKSVDIQLLTKFREMDIPHQIVLAKIDKLLFPTARIPSEKVFDKRMEWVKKIITNMKETVSSYGEDEGSALGEIIACSAEKTIGGKRLGIDAVQFAILRTVEMELKEPVNKTVAAHGQEEIVPYDDLVWND